MNTTLSIRYEGGDAVRHEIDLNQLGVSLQGFARIFAVTAHFLETGQYKKQYDALFVRVVAKPTEEHHCFEVMATLVPIATSAALWSGLGTAGFTAVVSYIFSRRKDEEMKHLSEALNLSIEGNGQTVTKMLATIERLADAVQPSVKQALEPIGRSAVSINIRDTGNADSPINLDQSNKDAAVTQKNNITPASQYHGLITELDVTSGACKVSLQDDGATRITSIITDPQVNLANNPYANALAQQKPIAFTAKAVVDEDGEIMKLYISDLISAPSAPINL